MQVEKRAAKFTLKKAFSRLAAHPKRIPTPNSQCKLSPRCGAHLTRYVRMHCTQIATWGILGYPVLFFWGILGYPGVSGVSCASVAFSQPHMNSISQCENVNLASAVCLNHNSCGFCWLPLESMLGTQNLCRIDSFIILERLKGVRALWRDIWRSVAPSGISHPSVLRILQAAWLQASLRATCMRSTTG